jgi:hypothetical protein
MALRSSEMCANLVPIEFGLGAITEFMAISEGSLKNSPGVLVMGMLFL